MQGRIWAQRVTLVSTFHRESRQSAAWPGQGQETRAGRSWDDGDESDESGMRS